jgi:hypothetical protein
MSTSEFERTWRHFVAVLGSGDRAAALEALKAWQRVWDRTFWNREFEGWDAVYEDDAELVNHTKFFGLRLGRRGTTRWREARDEVSDMFRHLSWEARDPPACGRPGVGHRADAGQGPLLRDCPPELHISAVDASERQDRPGRVL